MARHRSVWPKVLVVRSDVAEDLDERVWDQCRTLLAANYEVSVIGPPVARDLGEIRYYARRRATGPLTRWSSPLATWVLSVRVLYERGFDFVQWNNPPDSAWLLLAPYRILGKRLVYDQRDDWVGSAAGPRRRWRAAMEAVSYRSADRVIVARPPGEDGLGNRAAPQQVTAVPSGPVPLLRGARHDDRLLAGQGRLCCAVDPAPGRGGGELVLRTWAHLAHTLHRTDLRLALLTLSESGGRLSRVVRQLQLDGNVEVVAPIDVKTLSTYLATASLCIVADIDEGLPDAVLSTAVQPAMSAGLPHVAFDRPALRRVLGPTALYAPAGDIGSLASRVLELIDQELVRQTLGRAAAVRVASQLQWRTGAPDYVRTYDELLGIAVGRVVVLPHEESTPQEARYVVRLDARRDERRRPQRSSRSTVVERRRTGRRADDRLTDA